MQGKYQEKKAGNVGLDVNNSDLSGVFFDIGVSLGYHKKYQYYDILPKFSINWMHALSDYEQKSTINFIGQSNQMNNSAIALQRDMVNIGAGVIMNDGDDAYLQLQYDLRLGDNLVGNMVSARYVHLF